MRDQNNKLPGLEALRFTAALSVLVFHYRHFFYVAGKAADFVPQRQPFYAALRLLYDYGFLGVQIFWCISGFIFFWKYKDAIAQRLVDQKRFFILRFSRLYPLHFATLLLVAALQAAYIAHKGYYFVYQNNDLADFGLQLLMASNWFESTYSFNGPIWSISVEVLIYLCFFMLLRYLGKSPLINISVVLSCVAAKVARVPTPVVDCLAFFYAGGLSAMALQYFSATRYKNLLTGLAMAGVVLVPLAVLVAKLYERPYFAFVFLLTYVPVLLYILAQDLRVHPTIQKAVEAAGNMTYASYLLHFPIQLTIALYFIYTNHAIPCYSPALFAAFILATLVASRYVYRLFEMPAQNYIRERARSPANCSTVPG